MNDFNESSESTFMIDNRKENAKQTAKRYLFFLLVNVIQIGIEFAYIVPISRLFFLEYDKQRGVVQQDQAFSAATKMTIGPILGFIVQIII